MISAKDIFTIEREMLVELQKAVDRSSMNHYEREEFFDRIDENMTEAEWNELYKKAIDREIHPLDRLKNGEYLSMSQINQAVYKAVNNE